MILSIPVHISKSEGTLVRNKKNNRGIKSQHLVDPTNQAVKDDFKLTPNVRIR